MNRIFSDAVSDARLIKVLEPGVAQNLDQIELSKKLELNGKLIDWRRLGTAAKARDHTRRLLAQPHRVDLIHEVHTLATQQGLKALVLPGRQCRNQIRLTGLRDPKKTDGHWPAGRVLVAHGFVTHAVQFVTQVIRFAVQTGCGRARLLNPVQRLGCSGMNGCPLLRQCFLFRGQFVHECFTVPLSSQ